MSSTPSNELFTAISELLDDREDTKYGSRDILTLCISCASQKKHILSTVRDALSTKFKDELNVIEQSLDIYKNVEFSLEDTMIDPISVQGVYSAEKTHISVGSNKHHQLCLKSVEDVKMMNSIILTNLRKTRLLTNCNLPINRRVYFLDQKMNYFEYIFMKHLYQLFKRQLKGLKTHMKYCIIVSKMIDASLCTEFFRDLKCLLKVLKRLGLKSSVQRSFESFLVQYDIEVLRPDKADFNSVYAYFDADATVLSFKFAKKIEKKVLMALYKDASPDFIIKGLESTDFCSATCAIFQNAGLKDMLENAFSLILPNNITADNFESFVNSCQLIETILGIFKDKRFIELYTSHFEHLLDAGTNCIGTAMFVDHALWMCNTSLEGVLVRSFDLISNIIEKSINPEQLLNELRNKLAIRLLEYRKKLRIGSLSPDLFRTKLNNEVIFLNKLKKMYSENMIRMTEDVSVLLNPESNTAGSKLLMTMCKWPTFSTGDVALSPDNPISIYKIETAAEMKEEIKNIAWVDSLSTVNIEIFGKSIVLSLFQFSVILRLAESCTSFNMESQEDKPKQETSYIKNLDQIVPPVFKEQFAVLLDDLILVRDDLYFLNPFFTKTDYTNFPVEFQTTQQTEINDVSYSIQAYNESRVAKLMKRMKNMELTELHKEIGSISEEELKETIRRLEEKDIISVVDGKISYCP